MKTETFEFNTANGASKAFAALPDQPEGAKAVILIHEWWGLSYHIEDVARRYAVDGFICIAPDLYRGRVTDDAQEASRLMHGLETDDALNTIESAMDKARELYGITHFGITGFCMGGTFALRAAIELEGVSAAVPFYGDIPEEDVLKNLKTPTVFISGTRDQWINTEKVAGLEDATERFELPVQSVKYDADHAFFNDTREEVYNPAAAKDAWATAVNFFNNNL
jgi:carboxymethylenebutenolidase